VARHKSLVLLRILVRAFHNEGTKYTKIPTEHTALRVLRDFVVNACIISFGMAFNRTHVARTAARDRMDRSDLGGPFKEFDPMSDVMLGHQ